MNPPDRCEMGRHQTGSSADVTGQPEMYVARGGGTLSCCGSPYSVGVRDSHDGVIDPSRLSVVSTECDPPPTPCDGRQSMEMDVGETSRGNSISSGLVRSITKLEAELASLRSAYEQGLLEARQLHTPGFMQRIPESENRTEKEYHRRLTSGVQQSPLVDNVDTAQMSPVQEDLIEKDILEQENEDLKKLCLSEQNQRFETEVCNAQLHQRIHKDSMSHQQKQELMESLHLAMRSVTVLESQVSDLSGIDESLPSILSKVRAVTDEELNRYHHESQGMFSKNMADLQSHVNDDVYRMFELNRENRQLQTDAGELAKTVEILEGQVSCVEQEKRALEHLLERERRLSQAYITRLEEKLAHLRILIVDKLKEVQAARDAQLPLLAEVDAFRVLLGDIECAKRRCYTPVPSAPPVDSNEFITSPTAMVEEAAQTDSTMDAGPGPVGPVGPIDRPVDVTTSTVSLPDVRAKSAPATRGPAVSRCQDYFDAKLPSSLVDDCGRPVMEDVPRDSRVSFIDQPTGVDVHDYATATSSSTGAIQIADIHPEGRYIRLRNASNNETAELGECQLVQNIGGYPAAAFRFPARVHFQPRSSVTVWAGCNDPLLHQPPSDFVFSEEQRWGTGPECTTILCKPNGQAVSWMTAAHRFSTDSYGPPAPITMDRPKTAAAGLDPGCGEKLSSSCPPLMPQYDLNTIGGATGQLSVLRREKAARGCLLPQRHPHGLPPATPSHPHTGTARPHAYGNDHSSLQPQSRSQSTRPDPVPGAPYAGAAAQRMGSALLQTYRPNSTGTLTRAAAASGCRPPPSSFQRPRSRFSAGLGQIRSQHNIVFQPPMPKPSIFLR